MKEKKRILVVPLGIQVVEAYESRQTGAACVPAAACVLLWEAKPSGPEGRLQRWVQLLLGSGCGGVTELTHMNTHLGPSLAKAPCLGRKGSVSFGVHTTKNKTKAEIEATHALFNGQRMEEQEISSQINFWS